MKAIGMIETKGLVCAIEALDSMLKAANVEFVRKEVVGSGIITVMVEGDVGAVKAAVEAGSSAAERVGQLLSTHVIPSPAFDVSKMLNTKAVAKKQSGGDAKQVENAKTKEAK